MWPGRYLAWFFVHFFLILCTAFRSSFWALGQGGNAFPKRFDPFWQKAEFVASATTGEYLNENNPLRSAVALYLHCGGIETGYGYFAPNVPDNYKLVFELHYPDGRIERTLPTVGSEAAGLRLVTLLDNIRYCLRPEVRRLLIQMLARNAWTEHPGAEVVRAVFGAVYLPTTAEFNAGKRETYDVLYAYDFRFVPSPEKPK
jgi:hypothetical protein